MGDLSEVDLSGIIDMHMHTAPDVWQRKLDDLEAARQASTRGMKAILLKSHWTLTADRARLVEREVGGLRVFGGLALNNSVGGFNPFAVEAALAMGAAEIWMPTLSAATEFERRVGPALVVLDNGRLRDSVLDILHLIAEHDAILGTGHLSPEEIMALIPAAHELGVRKIIVTHPEHELVRMPPLEQEELRSRFGVYFERCLLDTAVGGGHLPLESLVDVIRRVGSDSTIIATDYGQVANPLPVKGMARFILELRAFRFSEQDINIMGSLNPGNLLGI